LARSFISEIVVAETMNKRKESMLMINRPILTGNLGNDPEIFFGSEGDPVTSFSLAFKSGREKTGVAKMRLLQQKRRNSVHLSPSRRSYRCCRKDWA
jgi:hypothetical protein